ncbi:MAG: hypothetical protein ACYTFY_14665 [Planctomycetota bacterium]|jgi:hypothetical protein
MKTTNRLKIYNHSLYTDDALWDIFTERPELEDYFGENQVSNDMKIELSCNDKLN